MKLQWKIFAYLTAFCALLLVALWLMQTVFLTDMYKAVRRGEIARAIAYVEKNIDSENLQSIFEELQFSRDIRVMPTQEFSLPDWNMPGGRGQRGPETLTSTREFVLQDGRRISLTFYAMISPVSATVSTLKVQLYFITGIMVVLAIAIALLLARRVSRPIERLNEGAKQLAQGEYGVRFAGQGFLEVEELSDTLNTAAQELSKVEALRRELMANISHDLRTPLALIYSYAEMMHDFPLEITPEQTQVIMDETTRLSSLVNDVMDLSKLEAGVTELDCRRYNLTQSLDAVIRRMAALAKKDGYLFEFVHEGEVFVCADEVKITQVFYNLLINAMTHGGENRNIAVRQFCMDKQVTVEVADSGAGISPEQLPLIWDRYYKLEKTHRRALTGTGLGLSIVKKIVDLHGGRCGVRSQEGQGSVFWFTLHME